MLSSKVTIVEGEPGLRPIQAADSSVPAFVGVAERGPIGVPVLLTSFANYRKRFGGFLAGDDRHLPLAVLAFFENGGQSCYVVRTVHYADVTDPSSSTASPASAVLTQGGNPSAAQILGAAYPLVLAPFDQLVIDVNGLGDETATFDASPANATMGVGPFDLDGNETLTLQVNGGEVQSYTFQDADSAGATLSDITDAEVLVVLNREFTGISADLPGAFIQVNSDKKGTGASLLFGGAAAAVLGFPLVVQNGSGAVADIKAVTAAEVAAVVLADFTPGLVTVDTTAASLTISTVATGAAATLEPKAASADAFGLVEGVAVPGSDDALVNILRIEERYAANIAFDVAVQAATSGEADRFNLVISEGGSEIERWVNVSADSTAEDYLPDLLTESSSIFVAVDLAGPAAPRPDNQTAVLGGGDSGLGGLVDADFIGGAGAGKTGLRALDSVLDLSLLAIPGRASLEIATGLNTYAEVTREGLVFVVHDTPAGLTAQGAVTYCETTASLLNLSEFGAVYWPHVKVPNPSSAVFGDAASLTIPPSGPILGLYGRLDGRRDGGVYDSPAGWERAALAVLGLEDESVNQEAVRDVLYPKRINPIRTGPGRPIYVDGGRTLKAGGNWPNIAERRGVIVIKRSVKEGIDFARHQNHDTSLRAAVRRAVRAFLRTQMLVGAFRSTDEETAFYVTCDETNNPIEVVLAGKLVVDIGVATQKPAEFIEVTISQDTRAFAA